jgi:hypothetical protein
MERLGPTPEELDGEFYSSRTNVSHVCGNTSRIQIFPIQIQERFS